MSERETILGRIREALRVRAHRPKLHGQTKPTDPNRDPVLDFDGILPSVGKTFEERVAQFRMNANELRADFRLLNSPAELAPTLAALAAEEKWRRVATHRVPLAEQACSTLTVPVLRVDDAISKEQLESCDAGVSECDSLIAQTGSVMVTSRSAGGRALSVLPPHHVVVARREQLVGTLLEALRGVQARYAPDYPSMISVITGPSRTGDIERILVLGAHGPKKLTILCC